MNDLGGLGVWSNGCLRIGEVRFMPPGLLSVILTLIVVGVLLWLINTYIPMASGIKSLINGVVLVFTVLWLLRVFGVAVPFGGPIVSIVVTLIVVGVLMWLINNYIPMAAGIKT